MGLSPYKTLEITSFDPMLDFEMPIGESPPADYWGNRRGACSPGSIALVLSAISIAAFLFVGLESRAKDDAEATAARSA